MNLQDECPYYNCSCPKVLRAVHHPTCPELIGTMQCHCPAGSKMHKEGKCPNLMPLKHCHHEITDPLIGYYLCKNCWKFFDILDPDGNQPEDIKCSEQRSPSISILTIVIISAITTIITFFVTYEVSRIILDQQLQYEKQKHQK